MKASQLAPASSGPCTKGRGGFTLLELLTVIAVIAVVAGLLLPALSQARERARAVICLNNTRQLFMAWHIYASDDADRLAYNMALAGSTNRSELNWVNNVMTWDLSCDNTNPVTLTHASLGPFLGRNTAVYRCPSDLSLSAVQQAAGWTARNRSYAMNGMVGDAGPASTNGYNVNNPGFEQFFKSTQIYRPAEIFVFLDEQPNSIDDGSFLNSSLENSGGGATAAASSAEWVSLPATYHNHATSFVFADGHSALHRWTQPLTASPGLPRAMLLPLPIANDATASLTDFDWMLEHMSFHKN